MNKKAFVSPIYIFFSLIVFYMLWFLFLGGWLNGWAATAINDHSLTGLEAFLLANINIAVYFGTVLYAIVGLYYGN